MKKIFLFAYLIILISSFSFAQNVGIGTTTPNVKAALEIKSTDKGVLFPRLTTAQRNAITNPPNGLHVFNTDERCLNYFDSAYAIWNCYCEGCQTVVINITSNMCKVNFYEMYAKGSPAKKYLVNILAGVTITGCNAGDTALSFSSMLFDASVVINNYGTIAGAGGSGGNGTIETGCLILSALATPGKAGGYAVSAKNGVIISINNYGIVAGGGGGGGGSGRITSGYGGGGGGGAGITAGAGGTGGGTSQFSGGPINICVGGVILAQPGSAGQIITGGAGGAGTSLSPAGGNGGARAQAGQNGTGNLSTLALGGAAGKAIGGGAGNSIVNISGGQSFGIVD
jgi:hypothetical protein